LSEDSCIPDTDTETKLSCDAESSISRLDKDNSRCKHHVLIGILGAIYDGYDDVNEHAINVDA